MAKRTVKPKTFFQRIKTWFPTTANTISIFALIVSAILAIYTYKVFKIADAQSNSVIRSANAAIDAATTAKNTLDETKRYNKEYMELQRREYTSGNADAAKRNLRDSLGLDAQIRSLKQAHEIFVKENQPYLQIDNFENLGLGDNMPMSFIYSIYNLGNQPIKILTIDQKFVFIEKKDSISFLRNPFQSLNNPKDVVDYLPRERSGERTYVSEDKMTVAHFHAFLRHSLTIYFVGRYTYLNYITNQKRNYTFLLKAWLDPANRDEKLIFLISNNQDK